jgi:hypothetical protein
MSDLTKFSDGAAILQQVDVSDIFKNLAMGIAEAQQKLDDNSVAQTIRLAQTQINGVSLLSMGFAPVFYAFQYADISASINLKMAMKEALEFGFGIDLKLSSKKGYSETDHQFLSQDSYSETKEEYKTSRELSFKAKEEKHIKIDKHEFKLQEEYQANTRIEKLKEDIIERTSIEQIYEETQTLTLSHNQSRGIDVWIEGGFLRIERGLHYKKNGVGVLKIRDYITPTEKAIDVDGGDTSGGGFNLASNLVDSLTEAQTANTGTVYGLSKTGELYKFNTSGSTWDPISSTMYFRYNKDNINYTDNLKDGPGDTSSLTHTYPSGAVANQNHTEHTLIHQALRLIQSQDPDAKITITGMTDPAGGNSSGNKSLAKRRAENLRNHIFGTRAPISIKIDTITNSTGNSDLLKRFAKIELDADYIIFIDGLVSKNASPKKSEAKPNRFVYADNSTPNPFYILDVKYGSYTLNYSENNTFEELVTYTKSILIKDSYESKVARHYFLHDEAIVKFYMYTNESEDISIEESNSQSTNENSSESSFISSKTKNEQSELSDNVTKNSKDSSFALGASVDFRMAKQFEMSMEGNASMSARLVAVPAPEGFVIFIQNIFINNNSGSVTITN